MKKLISLLITFILLLSIFPTALADEYMNVYSLDGRVEVIKTSDFNAWHKVGWYSAPVMTVYTPDGRTEIIRISDFDLWHKVGWYSAPVMYVYAADGRKQLVLKNVASNWKAVGWDYQTGYADNIPWENDNQKMAVIDLSVGPYNNWRQNRNYYIDKYFIEMPKSDRDNIKHYSSSYDYMDDYGDKYLFIPRYKSTNTIIRLALDWGVTYKVMETTEVDTIYNGFPFTLQYRWPERDGAPMFRMYSDGEILFSAWEDLLGEPCLGFAGNKILDLTEWQYYSYY